MPGTTPSAKAKDVVVKITKDHLADDTGSSEGFTLTKEEIVLNCWGIDSIDELEWEKESTEFRLFDDDDELYFEGWIIDDDEALTQQILLAWAGKDSGCTRLLIKRGKSWMQEIG